MSGNGPGAADVSSPDPSVREDIAKELDALRDRLDGAAATNIGFPATSDFDYSALAPFFARYMLNNLGDPYSDGAYPMHTKPMEREVVDMVADLFGAPSADRWGYVAGGATEGTEYALHLASTLHSDAVVYHSAAAHHSVTNVIQRLGLTSIPVRTDALGEIDYDDLADQVNLRRNCSAIVVANIGTAVTEAVDDVSRIAEVLDRCAVRRRWIHGDAALSGIPLALLDPDDRPSIDFPAGIDSVVTSGHKFLGAPVPCAVVVVRNSHRLAHARAITYTGSPDTTVGNSRSGLAAMVLWYAIRSHGIEGLRARARKSRQLAAAAHDALREIGWPAHRHKHAMTVSFPTPPAAVAEKWVLATHGATSLIVCMPGVTAEQVDEFVADLRAAITPARGAISPARGAISPARGAVASPPPISGSGPAAGAPAAAVVPAQGGTAGPSSARSPLRRAAQSNPTATSAPIPPSNGASTNGALRHRDTDQPGSTQPASTQPASSPAASTAKAPAAVSSAEPLWHTGSIEETLAPMPSLAGEPLADVSPAPVPSLAGAALVARSAGVTAREPAPELVPVDTSGDPVERLPEPPVAAPPPAPPLLPTPPQSLQRQKMLRRAGMPIRL